MLGWTARLERTVVQARLMTLLPASSIGKQWKVQSRSNMRGPWSDEIGATKCNASLGKVQGKSGTL